MATGVESGAAVHDPNSSGLNFRLDAGASSPQQPRRVQVNDHQGCVSESAPLLDGPHTSSRTTASAVEIMAKIRRSRYLKLFDKLRVEREPGLTNAQLMLANHDLKPVEPERRQWRSRNFVAFWIADSFNINTWMIASASILDGLSCWQAWACVWVGYFVAALFICLTGRIGAAHHISFPVSNRASFGIWGSLWPVLNRVVIACIWYGVQSWIGGTCVYLMIRSIWPSWDEYATGGSKNSMPASSGTNTRNFISFLLFWLGSLPFLWFPVHKIRHLFTVKAYVVPAAGLGFFIWATVRARGIGPVISKGATVSGSTLAWAFMKGIMSSIGNFASMIVNNPDFARFSATPRSALWSQVFTIPCGFALTSFIGIITASSSTAIFNETIWSPLDLLRLFLEEDNANGATRFGVFVIASSFVLAQLGTNLAANSISAGTDLTALIPRYLTIRRGSYVCAIFGLVICPWHLLSSSNNFTTYLSAYSVFLSSIAGVMISDYYVVRKGFLRTKDLYSSRNDGSYYYTWGIHWRGYAAYIAGILINIVGFAGAVGYTVPTGATYSKLSQSPCHIVADDA